MNLNYDNLSSRCRVCLESSGKMYPLVGDIPNVDVNLVDMLNYCTLTEIELDDKLPKKICAVCFKISRIAYNFLQQLKKTNDILLEMKIKNETLQQVKVEEAELSQNYTTIDEELENLIGNCSDQIIIIEQDSDDNMQEENQMDFVTAENFESERSVEEDLESEPQVEENLKFEEFETALEVEPQIHEESSNEDLQSIDIPEENTDNFKIKIHHQCPICHDTFIKYPAFEIHLRYHQRNFSCICCNIDFDAPGQFITHYRATHKFQCHICKKSFKSRFGHQYHMNIHRKKEKPFKCHYENCTKAFYMNFSLLRHLDIHKSDYKYVCTKCGFKCKTYDMWQYHKYTHNEKRHLCPACGKSFILAVHLRDHMWQHTGIKQYKCHLCDKSYSKGGQLKKHKRRHHGLQLP